MSVYTPFVTMALRLIQKWGMDVVITTPVNGNPTVSGQDWKPTNGTATTRTVRMVFFPEETINFYSKTTSLIKKEEYQVGYEYYLMGANGFEPELNMTVAKGSKIFNIRYVLKYAPANEVVLYIVGLKE